MFLCLSLLLCLTLFTVETGYGQHQESPSKSRFLRWSYQDAADWVETTDRKRLLRTAGFVAVLVPLSLLDEEVSEAAMDWDSWRSPRPLRSPPFNTAVWAARPSAITR